jgi:hypothetical protein
MRAGHIVFQAAGKSGQQNTGGHIKAAIYDKKSNIYRGPALVHTVKMPHYYYENK